MKGSIWIGGRSYICEEAAGVLQFCAVVKGAADGGCKYPGGANASGFVGITQEAQPALGKGVRVMTHGFSRYVASGAVADGDRLKIAGTDGALASAESALGSGTLEIVAVAEGACDDTAIGVCRIQPQYVPKAAA